MESARSNYPTFDRNINDSLKYNQAMGREFPLERMGRDFNDFNHYETMPWNYGMDRWNMPAWFQNIENRMMPFYGRDWFNDFERRMMPFFDRSFDMNNMNFRPCHPIESYTLTHPIRVLDRLGNRELCLSYFLGGKCQV